MLQTSTTETVHTGQSPGSWELVAAAQGGDQEAFGRLYERYAGAVSRYVGRRADRALVEDFTSETFTRAFNRVGSVSDQGRDVGAWFTTIAQNLIRDHYKSSRAKREHLAADPQYQGPAVVDDHSPEPAGLRLETTRLVRNAVAKLPTAAQRDCIRLRFLEERSVAETAAVMRRGPAAVKALTHRALLGLRAQLAQDYPERLPEPRETTDSLSGARHAVAAAHQHVHTAERAAATRETERGGGHDTSEQANAGERAAGEHAVVVATDGRT